MTPACTRFSYVSLRTLNPSSSVISPTFCTTIEPSWPRSVPQLGRHPSCEPCYKLRLVIEFAALQLVLGVQAVGSTAGNARQLRT
jgi:hypothetical protein